MRTCTFYAVGASKKALRAYDEYDSKGSGLYYTDDVFMCDRHTAGQARAIALSQKLNVYYVEIHKTDEIHTIEISEVNIK